MVLPNSSPWTAAVSDTAGGLELGLGGSNGGKGEDGQIRVNSEQIGERDRRGRLRPRDRAMPGPDAKSIYSSSSLAKASMALRKKSAVPSPYWS